MNCETLTLSFKKTFHSLIKPIMKLISECDFLNEREMSESDFLDEIERSRRCRRCELSLRRVFSDTHCDAFFLCFFCFSFFMFLAFFPFCLVCACG